jgi:hypothetical protein
MGMERGLSPLKEGQRLRVSKNRALWIVFGPKREEVTGDGENSIMRHFIIMYSSSNISQLV